MQFKVDENLHSDAAELLRQHGHDALTVADQGLRGKADVDIASVCLREGRTIVTLDLDFSDIRLYPPGNYHGIIVLRLNDQSRASVLNVLGRIVSMLGAESPVGRLWIVDEHHVRIRDSET